MGTRTRAEAVDNGIPCRVGGRGAASLHLSVTLSGAKKKI